MIFILGGRGFVGSGVVRWCESTNTPYQIVDRQNYADLRGQRCDVFVNANGNSKKPLATREPLVDFDASVRSVRASLVDFQFDTYLHLSSCDVYPDCSTPNTTVETQVIEPSHQSPYGFHKYLAEQCVRHSAKRFVIARLGGFVGPGLKKNAIFDIMQGGPLWLHPDSELQFMHTDDCARILMALVQNTQASNRVFNVCGKGTVQLASLIASSGKDVTVKPDSPKVRYDVNIEQLERLVDVPSTRVVTERFIQQDGR